MATTKEKFMEACDLLEKHASHALQYAKDLELLNKCKTAADYEEACRISYKLGYSDMGEGRSIDEMKEYFKVNNYKFSFPNLLLALKLGYCIYNINEILKEEMLTEMGELWWELDSFHGDVSWLIAFSDCGLEVFHKAFVPNAKDLNLSEIVNSAVEKYLFADNPVLTDIPLEYRGAPLKTSVPQTIFDCLGFGTLRDKPDYFNVDASQIAKKLTSKTLVYDGYYVGRLERMAEFKEKRAEEYIARNNLQ